MRRNNTGSQQVYACCSDASDPAQTTAPRRGFALLIVLGVLICFGIWLASLSYTMSGSRNRFLVVLRQTKAHFLARSALQHFFLKVKTMQRALPEAILVLEEDAQSEHRLAQSFTTDILLPDILLPDIDTSEGRSEYGINRFSIGVIDRQQAVMTVNVSAFGTIGGFTAGIDRVLRISR